MHRHQVIQLVRRSIQAAATNPVKPQAGELTVRGLARRLGVPDRLLLRWIQENASWLLPPDRMVEVGGGNSIRFWKDETAARIVRRKHAHHEPQADVRPPDGLTIEQVAAHYGVRSTIVRGWLRSGKLPPADGKGRGRDGSRRQFYWLKKKLPPIDG